MRSFQLQIIMSRFLYLRLSPRKVKASLERGSHGVRSLPLLVPGAGTRSLGAGRGVIQVSPSFSHFICSLNPIISISLSHLLIRYNTSRFPRVYPTVRNSLLHFFFANRDWPTHY